MGQLPFALDNRYVFVFGMEMGRNNHSRQLTDMDHINAAGFVRIARNHFTIDPHWPKVHNERMRLAAIIAFTAGGGCQQHQSKQSKMGQMRSHSSPPAGKRFRVRKHSTITLWPLTLRPTS